MSKAGVLLDQIVARLRDSDEVQAVWLAGSRGRGTSDDLSDIDIWVALDDSHIDPVVGDPLTFVHQIVPTIMHILAPSIAPSDGAFIGSWVPVEDQFVQVDWYFTPASTAKRDADTVVVLGNVPVRESHDLPPLPAELALEKAEHNLALAMQMLNNMVKHARRGNFWRTAEHARHTDTCLTKAQTLLQTGEEPDFLAAQQTLLSEPPPTTAHEVQQLASDLVDTIEDLAIRTNIDLDAAISAMRSLLQNLRDSGWKPAEEYYRTLPRRYMGAGMLFTDDNGNVLLVETTYKDLYEIPGGVVESGESPRETAQREIAEELGNHIKAGPMLVFDTRSQPQLKGDAVMILYDGGVIDDPSILRPDGEEIKDVHFLPIHQLDQVCTPQMATRLRAAICARESGRTIEIADGQVID